MSSTNQTELDNKHPTPHTILSSTQLRWEARLQTGLSVATLLDFHSRHKLLVMAHEQQAYRQLGRLLASATPQTLTDVSNTYWQSLSACLQKPARRGDHVNVLQHIAGYLKRELGREQRAELEQLITCFRLRQQPLHSVIQHLRALFAQYPHTYISQQVYLYDDTATCEPCD